MIQSTGTAHQLELWSNMLTSLKARRDRQNEVRAMLVEDSLFKTALKGDVRACITWLKVHMPEVWDGGCSPPGTKIGDVDEEIEKMLVNASQRRVLPEVNS